MKKLIRKFIETQRSYNETKKVNYVDTFDMEPKKVTKPILTAKEQRLKNKWKNKAKRARTVSDCVQLMTNGMRTKNLGNRRIIILTVASVAIIKGKLGMPRGDLKFWTISVDMQAIIYTNASTLYTPVFAWLSLWKTQNAAFKAALDEITAGNVDGPGDKVTALSDLKKTLNLALAYINGLASANQRQAVTIIEGCLMVVIVKKERIPVDFTVKQLPATGSIKLQSASGKFEGKRVPSSYEWQYSVDGGKTWLPLPGTLKRTTIALAMAVNVSTLFRKRITTTKGGTSDWVVCKPILVA